MKLHPLNQGAAAPRNPGLPDRFKGGGYPPLPAGYAFRTFGGVPLNLNGTYIIYKVS